MRLGGFVVGSAGHDEIQWFAVEVGSVHADTDLVAQLVAAAEAAAMRTAAAA